MNTQVEEQKSELGRLQKEKEKYQKSLDNLSNRNQKFQQRLSDVICFRYVVIIFQYLYEYILFLGKPAIERVARNK